MSVGVQVSRTHVESKDNLCNLVVSFCHVSTRTPTQAAQLQLGSTGITHEMPCQAPLTVFIMIQNRRLFPWGAKNKAPNCKQSVFLPPFFVFKVDSSL